MEPASAMPLATTRALRRLGGDLVPAHRKRSMLTGRILAMNEYGNAKKV
jgi:hypothetical protein